MLQELIKAVDEYLVGGRTLRDIEAWLAAGTRAIRASGDQRAADFANELDADLVDFGEGLINETEIRERWEGYVRRLTTVALEGATPPAQDLTSTESITVRSEYAPESDLTLWLTHQFAA